MISLMNRTSRASVSEHCDPLTGAVPGRLVYELRPEQPRAGRSPRRAVTQFVIHRSQEVRQFSLDTCEDPQS